MLARFTNRVLSGTILRGFEPCPLLELFRLLKVPRIAPLRFSRSGVFRGRSNGRRGIRTPFQSTRSSIRLVSFRLGPRWSSFTGSDWSLLPAAVVLLYVWLQTRPSQSDKLFERREMKIYKN